MAGALDGIQIARPGKRFHAIGREAQGRETLDRALALEHLGCGGPCVHGSVFTSCRCSCQALSESFFGTAVLVSESWSQEPSREPLGPSLGGTDNASEDYPSTVTDP